MIQVDVAYGYSSDIATPSDGGYAMSNIAFQRAGQDYRLLYSITRPYVSNKKLDLSNGIHLLIKQNVLPPVPSAVQRSPATYDVHPARATGCAAVSCLDPLSSMYCRKTCNIFEGHTFALDFWINRHSSHTGTVHDLVSPNEQRSGISREKGKPHIGKRPHVLNTDCSNKSTAINLFIL